MPPSDSAPPKRIAIVGAGCAGTLVATQLLKRGETVHITLIERNLPAGRGVAYGTDYSEHRLNVPAARMSAFPDEPGHFLEWVRGRAGEPRFPNSVDGGDFLPRWIYGRYLAAVLEEAREHAAAGASIETVAGEAVDLEETAQGPRITLADGTAVHADAVVLALGILPGEYPIRKPLAFYHNRRYLHSPLLSAALEGVPRGEDILIVGAGLTAIDIIVQCHELGCEGVIHALSRRGLRPLVHAPEPVPWPAFLTPDNIPKTIRGAVSLVRSQVRAAKAQGIGWRAVVDSIRPASQELWRGLSWAERARFMRHVRPFWETHRHRVPPQTAAHLRDMEAAGRLKFLGGRLTELRADRGGVDAVIRERASGNLIKLRVAKVINCTGPRTDYSKYQHPLMVNLLAAGLVGHDPLALGIDALPSGQVLRYGGRGPVPWLFTLGAPLKGVLWESTAVPEIRAQARALAGALLNGR